MTSPVDIDVLIDEVTACIDESRDDELRVLIGGTEYAEFVEILSWLDLHKIYHMLKVCGIEFMVRAILYVSYTQRTAIIDFLTEEELISILEYVDMYSIFDVVICVPEKRLLIIMDSLSDEKRLYIEQHLEHDKRSVHRIARKQFILVKRYNNVACALQKLRTVPQSLSGCRIYHIFVEDGAGKYIGAIPVADIFRYSEEVLIGAIVRDSRACPIDCSIEQGELVNRFMDSFFLSAPVLQNGKILGVVVADDLSNLFGVRADKDIENITGVNLAREMMDAGIFRSVATRIPWIGVHLFFALGTSFVIDILKNYVEDRPYDIVTTMVPTVVAVNSMCGTHSMMLIMDMLVDQQNAFYDIAKFVVNEIGICILIGTIASVIPFLFFWYLYELRVGIFCVYSVMLTCVLATCLGIIAPILVGWITRRRPSFLSPTIVSFSVETLTYCIMFALVGLFA